MLPSSLRLFGTQTSDDEEFSPPLELLEPFVLPLELELFCESLLDFTELDDLELPPEDVPLSVTELEEIASSSLEDETSAIGSGSVLLELSSQAVIQNIIIAQPNKQVEILRLHFVPLRMTRFNHFVLAMTFVKIFTEDLQL